MTTKLIQIFRIFLVGFSALILLYPNTRATAQLYEDEPNEYIFQVLMDPGWTITEAIFGYEKAGKYYLPVGELAEGYEFYVDVDTEQLYAEGFASREENSFIIDARRGELVVKGEKIKLNPSDVLESEFLATNDIYIEIGVLNDIWPIEMDIDLSTLTIHSEAEEELSFIRNKQRGNAQAKLEARQERMAEREAKLPRRDNPYEWWGNPVIDYQGIYQYNTDNSNFSASNIFSGLQHIGKMTADYSVNLRLEDEEFQTPENIRLKFSRVSADGDYFPIQGIRNFEGGDITLRQRELISNTESGRGLYISNDNRIFSDEFDRVTVEGSGPPGWDIEVYNNDELVATGVVPDDGEYIFDDVILNYGNNDIKILFFGPQGQVREEVRRFSAGGNMLPPGQFRYSVGAIDLNRDFIELKDTTPLGREGLLANGDVYFGITNSLTGFATYSEVPDANTDRSYVTGGIIVSTPLGLNETEVYKELDGGQAISSNLVTSIAGFRTNLMAALYDGFESQDSGFGTNAKTFETEAQINKNVKPFGVPLGLRLNTTHTERETGPADTDIRFSQTYSKSGIRVTHSLVSSLSDFSHDQTTGSFITTSRDGPWQLRGAINYDAYPDMELGSTSAELRYRKENSFQASLNSSYDFQTSDYSTGVQLGYDFGEVLGSFETTYGKNNGFDFILRATSSFHPYTPNGKYGFTSSSRRNYSPVNGFIFLDHDDDGLYDEEIDEPLEDAGLRIGGANSQLKTNAEGYVVTNAPVNRLVNVRVDKSSLIDPYYTPGSEGFSFVPIRGKMMQGQFPVIETGSIEGEVKWLEEDTAVAGLDVDLVDENGETVMSVRTAFDGYFSFEFVPPGNYKIVPSTDESIVMMGNEVTTTAEDPFAYGEAIYIKLKPSEYEMIASGQDPFVDIPLPPRPANFDPVKALFEFYEDPMNYE